MKREMGKIGINVAGFLASLEQGDEAALVVATTLFMVDNPLATIEDIKKELRNMLADGETVIQ
jgi:hypothetical protein